MADDKSKAFKKAKKRDFKEMRRPMGVYRVHCKKNGKSLVGSSADLTAILNRHRAELSMAGHRNRRLQDDWRTFGPDAFDFEVLDTLERPEDDTGYDPVDDLHTLEELWLEKLTPYGEKGYNRPPRPKDS